MFQSVLKEQLKVPAKIEYLGELRDFVTKVGHHHGFSERVINAFKLSIDEAATNIIKHAYRDWEGNITIRAIVKKNCLTIVLIDQGKYFDPRQVSDPDLQRYVDIGKKGGLGIFIMRRLLDEIDYRKTEEGNELWLSKYRDVARKRRIVVPSLSLNLKARYWFIAMAVFTVLLLSIYFYYFFRREEAITDDYLVRGRTALSVLASDVSTNMQQQLNEAVRQNLIDGTNLPDDIDILAHTARGINTLQMSEYRDILFRAFIIDNNGFILASSEDGLVLEHYDQPADARILEKDVYTYKLASGEEIIDIVYPVLDEGGKTLCKAHFLIQYNSVRSDISRTRWADLNVTGLVWLIGAAGLFLLIYLVMNPFRRLSEWVKQLGQPGVADEMDIDASTEIGEIAQAFSDITLKLRESQVNLAEQERLQKEMQVAQEIQQTLLPSEFPEIEGYQLDTYYAAAKEVGGDYYDFVEVDKDTLGIVVADVSGKGVPGSLVMTMIRTALRTEARGIKDAAEVLARVNDFVVNDMKKGMFVTLFYVIIDSRRRRLNYASAGHNPMILYRPSRKKTYYLNPHGFPIGISLPDKNLFRNTIESDTLSLNEGDILLMYTDGITEAMNRRRQLYGEERFLNVIREYGDQQASDFVEKLHEDLLSFTEGTAQSDDITLVAIKEQSTAEKIELDRAKRVYVRLQQGSNIREACEAEGLSTYAYYSKYKELFEGGKVEELETGEVESIESKHLSIEEKTKLYDVIMRHPEYGAKKVAEELFTERYGFLELAPAKIYEELVRAKLNTKELREAFVNRGGKKRRPKPPGTPMLTLDGRVIIQKGGLADLPDDGEESPDERAAPPRRLHAAAGKAILRQEEERSPQPEAASVPPPGEDEYQGRNILSIGLEELLHTPMEDLFDKRYNSMPPPKAEAVTAVVEEQPDDTADKPTAENDLSLEELGFSYAGSETREKAPAEQVEPDQDADRDVSADSHIAEEEQTVAPVELTLPPAAEHEAQPTSEEFDFAAILNEGGGLEDPFAQRLDNELFPKPPAEDAEIVHEEAIHVDDAAEFAADLAPALTDAFDEFLEMDEEQRLINNTTGELETDIVDQILQNEIADRINRETQPETAAEELSWTLKEPDPEEKAPDRSDRAEHRLSFDELIDLLSTEPAAEEQWAPTGSGNGHGQKPVDGEGNGEPGAYHGSNPERDRTLAQALSLFLTEEFEQTIDICTSILSQHGDDGQVRALLGQSYFRTQRYREAAQQFRLLLKIDPKNRDAHEKLGVIYANQGAFPQAIYYWEQLLQISPDRRDIRDSIQRAKRFMNQSEST